MATLPEQHNYAMDISCVELHPGWHAMTQEQKLEFTRHWMDALADRFVVSFVQTTGNPRADLSALIKFETALALSPEVSKEAQALIDRGRAEAFLEILGDTHGKS